MTPITKIPPAPRWEIDSIFPGGSDSPEFAAHRKSVKASIDDITSKFENLPKKLDDSSLNQWTEYILLLQELIENIELAISYPHMLISQNVADDKAHTAEAEGYKYLSEWEKFWTNFNSLALKQDDAAWDKLVSGDQLKTIRFVLDRYREMASKKLSAELESLALDLGVDGYHGWNRIYDKMAGDLRVDFDTDGSSEEMSLGQLATKMSSPDRAERKQAFEKMTEAWKTREDLAAMTLNSQAGFRLALYKRRGWDENLFEPLHQARLSKESLEAMWSVISRETHKLQPYIDAKKKLLGIDKYRWYDEYVTCGQADKLFPYDEAAEFIIENVSSFSKDMADFCRMAIDKKWIEAENRSGKAGGGYCTGTGPLRQARIFMTYAGSYENLLTLAHELGHAYHSWILRDRPFLATDYPMTLAETASIFAETLVNDAAMSKCTDSQEKLMLLDQKLQQPYTMFCNIHCRYLFDVSFYNERKKGVVGKDRLNELMVEAQKKAFGSLLDESGHHPLFWASKLHFFITDAPFYNYPYTFGYLFAGGVYDRAIKEGAAFAPRYSDLLADTGVMTAEQVAQKHLGVDLTKEDFWNDAVARSLVHVDEFVKLAGE